jgi:hypothetical protein
VKYSTAVRRALDSVTVLALLGGTIALYFSFEWPICPNRVRGACGPNTAYVMAALLALVIAGVAFLGRRRVLES